MEWKPCVKKPIKVHYREVIGEKEEIETREGKLFGYAGKDYIIKGINGEIYPIKKEIFEQTYTIDETNPMETMANILNRIKFVLNLTGFGLLVGFVLLIIGAIQTFMGHTPPEWIFQIATILMTMCAGASVTLLFVMNEVD